MTAGRPDDGSFRRDLLKLGGLVGGAIVLSVGVMIWAMSRHGTKCLPVEHGVLAPDSMAEAVVWHFECGFPTRGMVGVNVRVGRVGSRRSTPVMSAMDTSISRLFHGTARPPRVEVKWRAADTLDIRYDASANLVHSERRTGTIVIRYHAVAAADSAEPLATPSRDGE